MTKIRLLQWCIIDRCENTQGITGCCVQYVLMLWLIGTCFCSNAQQMLQNGIISVQLTYDHMRDQGKREKGLKIK